MEEKYSIFVASSVGGLEIARALQSEFQHDYHVAIWNQGLVLPSRLTIESLQDLANSYDFGVFIFMPEDVAKIKNEKKLVVRDNVLFECGLFFSAIGRKNCFFLVPSDVKDLRIPSDLWGIEPLRYNSKINIRTAIGPACNDIRDVIRKMSNADGKGLSLSGEWDLDWYVPHSKHYKEHNISRTLVRHIGERFMATCQNRDLSFELIGKIRNGRYITGTWGQSELYYFGAFQIIVSPNGDRMSGKSVGFRSDNKVAAGIWEWKRTKSGYSMAPTRHK